MGTIAARDCLRIMQLTEQVTAGALLSVCQGLDLRFSQGDISPGSIGEELRGMLASVRELSDFVTTDRALERDLRTMVDRIQHQYWSIYPEDSPL